MHPPECLRIAQLRPYAPITDARSPERVQPMLEDGRVVRSRSMYAHERAKRGLTPAQ